MGDLWGFLAVVAGVAAIMGGFMLLARRIRRTGNGGGIMGPIDEVYNPAAHRSRIEVRIQQERTAPSASADDRPPLS